MGDSSGAVLWYTEDLCRSQWVHLGREAGKYSGGRGQLLLALQLWLQLAQNGLARIVSQGIGMDFITGLPLTLQGNDMILTFGLLILDVGFLLYTDSSGKASETVQRDKASAKLSLPVR